MRRAATALAVLVAVGAAPGQAGGTTGYNTVPCWTWDGTSYYGALEHKPRRCTLGGSVGYQQVDLVTMRWRSWAGATAYGRGTSVANMGVRARVTAKLYRRVRWEETTYRFTRARFKFAGRGWGPALALRLF